MRPFEGIRVLDLTHVLAGPYCTYQLALLGADVIKIENPTEPDMARGRGAAPELNDRGLGINFQVQASNKRALALNLRASAGRQIFTELVKTADVLVQNYRTGALTELGLGPDELLSINPRLIHCSLTGFGATGPLAVWNAYDNTIQATSGMMVATNRSNPMKAGPSVVDYASGMTAAFAIASALLQRGEAGRGQIIDCAMLDVAMMFMAPEISADLYEGQKWYSPKEAGLGVYDTREGQIMLGAFNTRQNTRLWEMLERPDFAGLTGWTDLWDKADEMRAALATRLVERTASEWEQLFNEAGIPAQRVRTPEEAARTPQFGQRDYFQPIPGAAGDPSVLAPASPFKFAHGGGAITSPPPSLGEHSAEVLSEIGVSAETFAALRSAGVVA